MSGEGPEQQTLALSIDEARVLRGAMHVVDELNRLDELPVELPIPIDSGRAPVFERLLADLGNRIRMATQTGTDSVITVLDRAEAQAVRDAAGLLPALASTAPGRRALVEARFLNTPRSEILQSEIRALERVAERIEPTNVRDVEAREIEFSREELQGMIDRTIAQIRERRLPWDGFATERSRLNVIENRFGDPDVERDCQRFFKALVVVTRIAVAGVRHMNEGDRADVGNFPVDVDGAYEAVVVAIEGHHCLDDETVLLLFDFVDPVVNSLTPRADDAVTENALELLDFIETLEEPPEGGLREVDLPPTAGGFTISDELVIELQDRLRITRGKANAFLEAAQPEVRRMFGDASPRKIAEDAASVAADRVALPSGVSFTDARRGIRDVLEDALEELSGPGTAAKTEREQLQRIDQLRSELETVLEVELPQDDLAMNLDAVMPSIPFTCNALLVSLAELTQIAAQAAVQDWFEFVMMKPIAAIADRRRFVLNELRNQGCLDDDTIRDLQSSIQAVTDPLEDDPEDVETRAFAALSDIRNAFQDPRRG